MNDIITVEDLAGLEALPVDTTFKRIATGTELRITEAGVRRSQPLVYGQNTEWTKAFIADSALPAAITNPEILGGAFAGIGDRVQIVEDDDNFFGTDYVGSFGILREINDQSPDNFALRIELETPIYSHLPNIWVKTVTPAPLPTKPTPQVGDRVRVVREFDGTTGYLDGMVGTLTNIDINPAHSLRYSVNLDNYGSDCVHEVDFEHDPEPTPEHPVVLDRAGLDALADHSVIVGIGSNFSRTPLVKFEGNWLKPGLGGTYNYLVGDMLGDQGVLAVHAP